MPAELSGTEACVRLSRADLETLVHAATLAPSPDNNQPWLFEERPDGELLLLHDRTRALPSDVNDMFSMIALGAALENLCIAGRQHGWEPQVRYVVGNESNTPEREVVAGIRFAEGGKSDPLYPFLAERITCRKLYSRRPVAEEALRALEGSIADQQGLKLHWVSDRPRIRKLAWLVAATDRIRFEYEPFHAELYRQLRFTPEEAEATRDGLDVRCLELPPGGAAVLRWLREWPRMRRLNRLGLSRLMSLSSALQVWRTGTIGLLTTEDSSARGYLLAGRALQRIWLTTAEFDLAFHPLGSLPIFLSRLTRQLGEGLTMQHRNTLREIAQSLEKMLSGAALHGVAMLFRLGKATAPSDHALRLSIARVLRCA